MAGMNNSSTSSNFSNSYPEKPNYTPNSKETAISYAQATSKTSGGNLTIGELTVGTSASGAIEYYKQLEVNAIDKAIEALRNTESLYGVFRSGWQGQAELNFEKNFTNAVESTVQSLESIKINIESLIARLVEQWAEEDKNIVDIY